MTYVLFLVGSLFVGGIGKPATLVNGIKIKDPITNATFLSQTNRGNSSGILQGGKITIGLVTPTFTAGAYNDYGFYSFYFKHKYDQFKGKIITTDLNMLTSKIPSSTPYIFNGHIDDPPLITAHLKQLLPNDQISVITDADVHYNKISGFDVLILFHQEYVSQQEYDNLRNFVANGGTLVVFDGNVFMAEVNYSSANNSVTLVAGHTGQYNGRYASLGPI
jgi:hypothetical protein